MFKLMIWQSLMFAGAVIINATGQPPWMLVLSMMVSIVGMWPLTRPRPVPYHDRP